MMRREREREGEGARESCVSLDNTAAADGRESGGGGRAVLGVVTYGMAGMGIWERGEEHSAPADSLGCNYLTSLQHF